MAHNNIFEFLMKLYLQTACSGEWELLFLMILLSQTMDRVMMARDSGRVTV